MKTIISYTTGLIIALVLAGGPVYSAKNSDDLEKGLQLMREEEKLAHDVYLALYEKWQMPVFNNIARAESRHFNAVGYLLETYNVEDPVYEKAGKFRNKELAGLYDELVEKGSGSLTAALEVGAFIEERDIQDLQNQLNAGQDELVTTVFGNLERASEMHLRAFSNQLAMRGAEYIPQVLDEASFLAITDTAPGLRGRGNRMLSGNGMNAVPGLRGRGNCLMLGAGRNAWRGPNCRQNFGMRNRGQRMRYNCIYN